jgi:hypothetical protein
LQVPLTWQRVFSQHLKPMLPQQKPFSQKKLGHCATRVQALTHITAPSTLSHTYPLRQPPAPPSHAQLVKHQSWAGSTCPLHCAPSGQLLAEQSWLQ